MVEAVMPLLVVPSSLQNLGIGIGLQVPLIMISGGLHLHLPSTAVEFGGHCTCIMTNLTQVPATS